MPVPGFLVLETEKIFFFKKQKMISVSECFDGKQQRPEAKTKLGNCMIFMELLCKRDEKGKRVSSCMRLRNKLSAISKRFLLASKVFFLFIFATSIKTRPRGNWNNLKNTPRNYFRSVVVSGRPAALFFIIFSSFSYSNLRFGPGLDERRIKGKTFGFYNAERQHKNMA